MPPEPFHHANTGVVNPARGSLRLKLIFDPASSKPQLVVFVAPAFPLSPLPTQQHVPTPANSTTRPHSVGNEHRTDLSEPQQGPFYRLLLSSSFVPVAACLTRGLSRSVFRPDISSYSFSLLTSSMTMSSWKRIYIVKRASSSSCRQSTYCDRPPLGAAEGPLGTALLKICVRTWHLTSHVECGPRLQPIPAGYIFFRETEQPILRRSHKFSCVPLASFKYFSQKNRSGKNSSGKFLIHIFSEFSFIIYFLNKVVGKK